MKIDQIIAQYDRYLDRRDYAGGGRFLSEQRDIARRAGDCPTELSVCNELIGHFRKNGERNACYEAIGRVLELIDLTDTENTLSAGTQYLNIATGYKHFGENEIAMDYYRKAEAVYDKTLPAVHELRAGLYNNMATALCDLGRFDEAERYYRNALKLVETLQKREDEAITYVNLAHLEEAKGATEQEIAKLLERALHALDCVSEQQRGGYYAFVCEKCAPSFGYFGHFLAETELYKRAKEIYERA